MARPTFICIGPGRCGTSWLHQVLDSHPQICMGRSKETEFFNTHFQRGYDWYEAFFSDCGDARAVGEISNNYYLDPEVAERIRSYDASIRLIINLRNPFDLLASIYGFGLRRGLALKPLSESLELPMGLLMGTGYQERVKAKTPTAADQSELLQAVLLGERIQPFLEAFPDDQIYFLIFERLRTDPLVLLRELYGFLGVDESFQAPMAEKVVNPSLVPRVRFLGRLASRLAFLLRKLGLYGLLRRLHGAERLKALLFNSQPAALTATQAREQLPPRTRERIEGDMGRLKDNLPALESFWPNHG